MTTAMNQAVNEPDAHRRQVELVKASLVACPGAKRPGNAVKK